MYCDALKALNDNEINIHKNRKTEINFLPVISQTKLFKRRKVGKISTPVEQLKLYVIVS